jgi:hypothetical protein
MMSGVQRGVILALLVPPALAILCVLAIAAAETATVPLFTGVPPANLAEAAAAGRGDDVARRLHLGEDLHRIYRLRPEASYSPVLRATPVEAAMWSGQLLMVQLLDREGAIADGAHRQELACLAADLEVDEEIVAYLSPDGPPRCVPQQARERVLARAAVDRQEPRQGVPADPADRTR